MDDYGKAHNDIAKRDARADELTSQLDLLEAVDRRITSEHPARRFRRLAADIGENDAGRAEGTSGGSTLAADRLGSAPDPRGTDAATAEIGYRGPAACAAAGITYRQLDYWARTGLVEPSVQAAHGSGSHRLYSFRDILVLKVVKRLLDTGISLQQIRTAARHLRDRGTEDLTQVTLLSDGVSVYECTSADEVVDLLQGGQGVFGIALGRIWDEVEVDLAALPGVRAEDGFVGQDPAHPTVRRQLGEAGQAQPAP